MCLGGIGFECISDWPATVPQIEREILWLAAKGFVSYKYDALMPNRRKSVTEFDHYVGIRKKFAFLSLTNECNVTDEYFGLLNLLKNCIDDGN
ncbi:hypothetical protein BDI4_1080028 [Burkholderia diffusa]|nr:hypothetical protein BDI4_1080028 [Burkholderia diffusa]